MLFILDPDYPFATGNTVSTLQTVDYDDRMDEGLETDDEFSLVDTEERVREAVQQSQHLFTATFLPSDLAEVKVLLSFALSGCGCKKAAKRTQCSTQFSLQYVKDFRASCAELSSSELDMAIMGQLLAGLNNSSCVSTDARHAESARINSYITLKHQGNPVCINMFRFLHGLGIKKFKNMVKHVKVHGLSPRVHGNTHRQPKHGLKYTSIEYVVRFLYNYAEQHALLLPGRVPGYSRCEVKLLPSNISKKGIWRRYYSAAEEADSIHPVQYSTFTRLWRTLVASIIVMKPRSDLCWKCQQNSAAVVRSANSTEAEKSATISSALEHLSLVKKEREYYHRVCEETKESVHDHFTTNDEFTPPLPGTCSPSNSRDIKVHYSFDYAQQVHFPSDPLQPGPIYW